MFAQPIILLIFGHSGLSWSQGVFNQPWRGTSQYRFPILPRPPDQTPDIQQRWHAMRGRPREQQYYRHAAIESNLLELTFALTSKVCEPLGLYDCFEHHLRKRLVERKTIDTRRI